MAPQQKNLDQMPPEQAAEVAAGIQEQVLSKSVTDALMSVRDEDLISLDPDSEVVKGPANQSGCWYHAPARLELFAAADRRLTRVAALDGIQVKRVERVDAKLIKGTKLLVLKAARSDNLSAVPVHRYEGTSSAWVNVLPLTGPAGLALETGYREWFDVAYIPKESPLFPGLVIDLGRPQERRTEPASKKKSNKQQPAEAAAGAKTEPGAASAKSQHGAAGAKTEPDAAAATSEPTKPAAARAEPSQPTAD